MSWWLDYENTISIVDEQIISELKKSNISKEFLKKAIKMKGIYNSNEEYLAKLQSVFGDNPYQIIKKSLTAGLRLRKRQFSGKVTYCADGYLGNYIIVDPINNLAAIRMISHQSYKEEKDNFSDFGKQVIDLIE